MSCKSCAKRTVRVLKKTRKFAAKSRCNSYVKKRIKKHSKWFHNQKGFYFS